MTRTDRPAHGRLSAMTIAVVAFVVAACGPTNPDPVVPSAAPTSALSSASASPSQSASASPSASASASASASPAGDLGKLVIDKMTGFDVYAKSVIRGEFDAAGARYEISGTFDVAGLNSHQLLHIHAPGQAAQETLKVSGTTYTRTGTGPWYAKPPSLEPSGVNDFLRTLKTMQDAGVESRNGKQLHHLTLPAGTVMPPATIGLTDPSIIGADGSIEMWAEEDGTLAVLGVKATWQQKNAAGALIDVTMAFEFTFSDVGTAFTIEAPDETWTVYASKINHVTISHPSDWDVSSAKKTSDFDAFYGPIYAFTTVGRYRSKGFSLNTLVKDLAAHGPPGLTKFKLEKVSTTKMGGVSARQVTFHATYKGVKQYWVIILALKSGYFYEFDLLDRAGHEADTKELAALFLSTVALK